MRYNRVLGLAKDVVVGFCNEHGLRRIGFRNNNRTSLTDELHQVGILSGWVKCPRDIAIARIVAFEMEAFLYLFKRLYTQQTMPSIQYSS